MLDASLVRRVLTTWGMRDREIIIPPMNPTTSIARSVFDIVFGVLVLLRYECKIKV